MPDWIAAVLLGIIEGITEFIPVSSTGHLLLVERLRWLPAQSELFNVVIQCGAVMAVLAVFFQRAKQLLLGWREPSNQAYLFKLAAAFIITSAAGLVLKKLGLTLEKGAIVPVALATLVGGILILAIEYWLKDKPLSATITWQVALVVAFGQLLAMAFPGTSRSGATILMAMALGVSRPAATEFSFLLGIPTLLAAGVYEILSAARHHEIGKENWSMVLLSTVVAALTAFLVVKWLLRYVQTHTFTLFGWYRIALAIAIFLMLLSTR
jgi:undecaprenyl-diphosphatase